MSEVDFDGEDFHVRINTSETIHIERLKLDVMADKDGKAATAAASTIASKECKARKRGVPIVWSEFRLLNTGNLYIVIVQE